MSLETSKWERAKRYGFKRFADTESGTTNHQKKPQKTRNTTTAMEIAVNDNKKNLFPAHEKNLF